MTWMPASRRGRAMSTARGKFIRLHADDADQAEPAILLDPLGDRARADARVGLVHGGDVDGKVGAEQLPLGGAEREAIDGGERVRRHGRAHPLHDVAVVVVMRRLDQDELKAPFGRAFGAEHPLVPGRRFQAGEARTAPAAFRFRLERLPASALSTPEKTAGWREAPFRPPPRLTINDSTIFPARGPTNRRLRGKFCPSWYRRNQPGGGFPADSRAWSNSAMSLARK